MYINGIIYIYIYILISVRRSGGHIYDKFQYTSYYHRHTREIRTQSYTYNIQASGYHIIYIY